MYQVINSCRTGENGPGFFRDVFLFGEEGIPLQGNRVINRFANFPDDQLLIWLMMHQNGNLEKIEGVTLPLYGDWSDNFWHWCFEALPVALAAHEGGFRGTYLVPDIPFAAASLRLLGIRPDRIRCAHGGDYYLECMCLSPKLRGSNPEVPAAVRSIREIFRCEFARPGAAEKIYVSRNGNPDALRRVVNEAELLALLARFDFILLHLEELSLEEQLAHTCNAEALIGPHGAGMTHCSFMPESSLVLELFAPTFINPCVLSVARRLKHRYHQITSPCHYNGYRHGNDIEAYLDIVELTLERELRGA